MTPEWFFNKYLYRQCGYQSAGYQWPFLALKILNGHGLNWKEIEESTLPETDSSHLKIGRAPKGNDRIPTIHFQGRAVSFKEGKSWKTTLPETNIAHENPHVSL